VSTAQDKEFIDDLLGEFDTNVGSSSRSVKKRREEPARKSRKLSPPRKVKKFTEMRSSPPPEDFGGNDTDDAGYMPQHMDLDDAPMSDAPVAPSSPAAKVLERRLPDLKVESDDDEEEFAVAAVKGNKNIQTERVNINATRPAKPVFIPEPVMSSPQKGAPIDSSAWTSVSGALNVMNSSAPPETVSLGKLSPENALEEDGSVKFFWMDYTEVNGALILFGKAQDKSSGKYVSAFLKVDGIMRNLFFLPRQHKMGQHGVVTNEEVEMSDVHQEITNILQGRKIGEFKAKSSSRKYAFELPDIPRQGDYFKVLYPYTSEIPSVVYRGKALTVIRASASGCHRGPDILPRFWSQHRIVRAVCAVPEYHGPMLAED
jgi:DNA polymerase alpha subunit A